MQGLAVVAAGGLSKRMNLPAGQSKQYLRLGRYPVICHTLKAFEKAQTIVRVAVATKHDDTERLRRLIKRYGFTKVCAVVEGGKERQDSIFNALQVFAADIEKAQHKTVMLIHDGARPLIQPSEIDQIAHWAWKFGACVPATKPKDTIKQVDASANFFQKTLERSSLQLVQTPQGFWAKLIFEAHQRAKAENFYATDDAALVERFFPNQRIKVFEMGYHNLKITTPEDVAIARAILKRLQPLS
ncbi:MAG: 2-C-methyl-D-erythritol 4-phosphate cytidylyltransferase [Chloroherpetonaceae bacterium]|nr:2-C-methyl-D-erythritol 4-phosphate cytidylyltransferase [Chloroherpetonaceae bacterium]